jgi:hypothetical protein
MAQCRCNSLFADLLTQVSAGGFNRRMADNHIKKNVAGAVYITLVNVLVLIKSGLFAVLDCSLPDRSLAVGICWEGA